MLQYDKFCIFHTRYESASPDPYISTSITEDELVTPAPAAPVPIVAPVAAPAPADAALDRVDIDIITDEVGAPNAATAKSAPVKVTRPDNAQYTHVYHDTILAADSDDYCCCATTASVLAPHLGPRIWQNSRILSTTVQMDRTYFQKTDLFILSNDDAEGIHQWYRQLVQQATSSNINLCPLRAYDSTQPLWPAI